MWSWRTLAAWGNRMAPDGLVTGTDLSLMPRYAGRNLRGGGSIGCHSLHPTAATDVALRTGPRKVR